MKKILEGLKSEARNSWSGQTGEDRAKALEVYLTDKLAEYEAALNIPQEELLKAWEKLRSYSAINYYQEANQPKLTGECVRVFDDARSLHEAIGKPAFRCPNCDGVSTSPYTCNSGVVVKDKICDWKSYGLFGTLGKGSYFFLKDVMAGEHIFTPIAWEEVELADAPS